MAKLKLHQVLALHSQGASNGEGALTRAYRNIEKPALLAGVSKTYEPVAEDGQELPSEVSKLQVRVPLVLRDLVSPLVRQFDLQATVDAGNQIAMADVVVDGVTIFSKLPVETLLFLEKKLNIALADFTSKLPVLDEAEDWVDAGDGLSFKTEPSKKGRTEKTPHAFVKAEATDKHPAQVETIYLDKTVGFWSTVKFSGAITATRKREMIDKLNKLREAVKVARGTANSVEVDDQHIGQAFFDFLGWTE